jgi:hypothetical protein
MNAERLHAIVLVLSQEMSKTNIVGKLQELINALSQVVNQSHTMLRTSTHTVRSACSGFGICDL